MFHKEEGAVIKVKTKECVFEMSGIFFFKNLALLAQFSEDLGPRRLHSPFRFKYKQVAWPLCSSVLLFIKKGGQVLKLDI